MAHWFLFGYRRKKKARQPSPGAEPPAKRHGKRATSTADARLVLTLTYTHSGIAASQTPHRNSVQGHRRHSLAVDLTKPDWHEDKGSGSEVSEVPKSSGATYEKTEKVLLVGSKPSSASTELDGFEIRICCCCNTRLYVLPPAPHFKCLVCDVTNVSPLDGHDSEASQSSKRPLGRHAPLSIDRITTLVYEMEDGDPDACTILVNDLSSAFGSMHALNQSFGLAGHGQLTVSAAKAALEQVNTMYRLLLGLESERPMQALVEAALRMLKRTKIHIVVPADLMFLIVILQNPLVYDYSIFSSVALVEPASAKRPPIVRVNSGQSANSRFADLSQSLLDVLEHTVGLLAYSNKACRLFVLNWLARLDESEFRPKVELLNAYVAHRLNYHDHSRSVKKRQAEAEPPASNDTAARLRAHARSMSASAVASSSSSSSSSLVSHLPSPVLGMYTSIRSKRRRALHSGRIKTHMYSNDWKMAAFVRVLALLFNADVLALNKVPISSFYNTMVDYTDVTQDFDQWQLTGVPRTTLQGSRDRDASVPTLDGFSQFSLAILDPPTRAVRHRDNMPQYSPPQWPSHRMSFCQFPFLLSLGSKIHILEYDARRQMEYKAQEAVFRSLGYSHSRSSSPILSLRINRDTLLEQSLDLLEANMADLKKGLRIEFIGEPGIDAGGLKKEWFMLLTREIFNPANGFFALDPESGNFWFNDEVYVHRKDPLRDYKLIGTVLGLALYNSTILDINLPQVLFKKLLGYPYTLEDFVMFRPSYGRSLQYVLELDDDEQLAELALTFVVTIRDKGGRVYEHELVSGGSTVAVTRANRMDYAHRVLAHFIDDAIDEYFAQFRAGFYSVVGGNALSLFRPEELELLVRGSPERIDVDGLMAVTKYQNWRPGEDKAVTWFWQILRDMSPVRQKKFLAFVTGSDRIPATGVSNMVFKISRLGPDCDRLPSSHTCFNQLCLYSYASRAKLESKLFMAMDNSQGFGIK